MRRFAPTRIAGPAASAAALALLLSPHAALAYGGPGSVVTGIGAFLAALAAVVAAVFGFLWFPVKRLMAKLRGDEEEPADEAGPEGREGMAAE